jgi:hypothetical protein
MVVNWAVVGRLPDRRYAGRLEDEGIGVPAVVLRRLGPELHGQLKSARVWLHHIGLGAGGQQ